MGRQTVAFPNVLFCDKSQWCISSQFLLQLLLLFIHFPSLLCINYRYFNEKCPMIGRKISKEDMNCHNKLHVLLEQTSAKWWCSQAYALLKRKATFAALLTFFSFYRKSVTLQLWYWGMHFIGNRFIVVSTIYWLTSDMVQALQNPWKILLTLNVDNNILVNMSHQIMITISAG